MLQHASFLPHTSVQEDFPNFAFKIPCKRRQLFLSGCEEHLSCPCSRLPNTCPLIHHKKVWETFCVAPGFSSGLSHCHNVFIDVTWRKMKIRPFILHHLTLSEALAQKATWDPGNIYPEVGHGGWLCTGPAQGFLLLPQIKHLLPSLNICLEKTKAFPHCQPAAPKSY